VFVFRHGATCLPHASLAVILHSLNPKIQGSGFTVQGSGFRVQGAGLSVQGSGFRVQG
jgi:hypothetical protein